MERSYYPAIDSLRAIAVMLVLFNHYFNAAIIDKISVGAFGVDIFFVISGFLITGILLSYKEELTVGRALKKFYFRRSLRIMPIYYLYLAIIFILFYQRTPLTELLYATIYCFNFYCINSTHVDKVFGHLWSLSVEEQFYLVWPFLILFVPRKYVFYLILLTLGVSLSFCLININNTYWIQYWHTLGCVQALATGALVKYFRLKNKSLFFEKNTVGWIWVGIVMWLGTTLLFDLGYSKVFTLLRVSASFTAAVILVDITREDHGRILKEIFNSKRLQYIGRISYGIYLYHILVKELLNPVIQGVIESVTKQDNLLRYNSYVITLPVNTCIAIVVASFSYKYIETPINKVKNMRGKAIVNSNPQAML